MIDAETFKQIVRTIAKFVDTELIPCEAEVEETDAIPPDLIQAMKEIGLFGLSIPQQYGGVGLSMEQEVRVIFEVGRASPAFRSFFATNVGIGSQAIVIDGTQEQREKYLPLLARGDVIGSFALTEPNYGSDAASIMTSAKQKNDHYILNGTKRFITNAPEAGLFTVMARTGSREDGAAGVSAFAVEADLPGILVGMPDKKMGQKGGHTADVIFENCIVPADALIGNIEGAGFKTAMKVLDKGRLHIAAACVGAAQRILEDSVQYAVERRQFGQEIASFQLIQAMIADCRTEILAARSMILDAARKKDLGQNVTEESSCCKYFASEMVGRVADRGVQIYGGAGYMKEYAVERFFRDVRLFRIYEGTSQIQQLIIAKGLVNRNDSCVPALNADLLEVL